MSDETYQQWAERVTRFRDCEICGGDAGEVHHIFRGSNKARTRREMCGVLFVCRRCHDERIHKGMPVATQLAYLMLRRPWDADIERCHKLTGRCWPYAIDVANEYERLRNDG